MTEIRRCSLCGAQRNEGGACSLIGCRDPLFDQREEEKLAAIIAAAEERGRRRGVEDLQTMLQNAAPHIIGAGHFRLWNCKCGYCAPLQAALAPRGSGKEDSK